MWRGSAFSALMHGALFFALLFGLPALPEIFKRTFDNEDSEVSISVEIVNPAADTGDAVLAPEQAAAARPSPEDARLRSFAPADSSAGSARKAEPPRAALPDPSASSKADADDGMKQVFRIPSGRLDDAAPRAAQAPPAKSRDRTSESQQRSPAAPAARPQDRKESGPSAVPTPSITAIVPRPPTDTADARQQQDAGRRPETGRPAADATAPATASRPAPAAPERTPAAAARTAQTASSPSRPSSGQTAADPRIPSPATAPSAALTGSRQSAEAAPSPSPASSGTRQAAAPSETRAADAAAAAGSSPASAYEAFLNAVDERERGIIEQMLSEDRRLRDAMSPREDHPEMPASARLRTLERLQAAANDGFPHAQFNIAGKYLRGEDVPQDYQQAQKWLTKAAEQGYAPAQVLIGLMRLTGVGLPRDLSETAFWWSLAAERGNETAKTAAERLDPLLKPREVVRSHQLRAQWGSLIRDLADSANQRSNLRSVNRDLQTAAEEGDLGAVLSMLARGADADSIGEDGRNAVLNAAWRGRNQVIRLLLQRGASTELTDEAERTPLLWAAINGHTSAASELIAAGANPNHRDAEGMTPLIRAAWNGHEAVVRALIQAGAKVGARNEQGMTALSYAQQEGHAGIAQLLRDAGAR